MTREEKKNPEEPKFVTALKGGFKKIIDGVKKLDEKREPKNSYKFKDEMVL